jgi:hypothetical protein
MIEFDHMKRITAADAMNHAYFIPNPSEMVKVDGNEFYGDSLSKYNQYIFDIVLMIETAPT